MRFVVYKSGASALSQVWRWRLVAANGKTIADSAEGYYSKADCLHGIELVKGTNVLTPVVEV
ncbi:DUF1508 domain-containing protein [Lysobacter sp. LF1]|uniref:DUF1508 domain-containing protein n=1 Tax=Lysobacter stagni TaxID=3045172 RepID=A0ABT6XI99_9GAMM|nr:DUF1508 domain-containing protein [Lysobacter sp. LF1]MDI9239867.1 DUF1508 domain-containing protein [Lysobacter sp. LF1]